MQREREIYVSSKKRQLDATVQNTQETATPPIDDLMVTLKTIQRKREEEELLRRQETAPVRDSATPVPSGEELSPSS